MKRPDAVQQKAIDTGKWPDEGWQAEYPHVCEYLCTLRWEDGTAREPSKLSISLRDGSIQVGLNDGELKQSAYTSAGSTEEALALLEDALARGLDVWRAWNAGKKRK